MKDRSIVWQTISPSFSPGHPNAPSLTAALSESDERSNRCAEAKDEDDRHMVTTVQRHDDDDEAIVHRMILKIFYAIFLARRYLPPPKGEKRVKVCKTRKSSTVSSSTLPLLNSSPCICRRATETAAKPTTRNLLYSPSPSLSEGRLKKGRKRNFQKRLFLQKNTHRRAFFSKRARTVFAGASGQGKGAHSHVCVP